VVGRPWLVGLTDINSIKAGVLGLQGCVEPHLQILNELGCQAIKVIKKEHLGLINRLIIPGGESSTMLKLLHESSLFDPLAQFVKNNPVWGVCAGGILLSKEVCNPKQTSFGGIDLLAHRNFYGSQAQSFKEELSFKGDTFIADFIRAPKLQTLSDKVESLIYLRGEGVLFRQGKILASAFHTELSNFYGLHRYFLEF
jgi:5'-phosphate synthase pdxT subunit